MKNAGRVADVDVDAVAAEREEDEARLRERRSMTGLGLVARRFTKVARGEVGPSSTSRSEESEGWEAWTVAAGSSMRKETDSRISARVEGFFIFSTLRAAGGARLPLSGNDSWRGLFRLSVVVFGTGG